VIQLKIYGHKSDGNTIEYECTKLIFQNFYVGKKRDELNLLVIRKFAEGTILLQDEDFNTLKDYFFSQQDAQIYIENQWHWCMIKFLTPNYLTKKVQITLSFVDQHSRAFDGVTSNSYTQSQIPYIERKFKVEDFGLPVENYFVDGSQYMYDGIDGNFWGKEFQLVEGYHSVKIEDILKWNTGGEDLEIGELIVGESYLDEYYKPDYIKYTEKVFSKFQHMRCQFVREYRYFEETETVPGDWHRWSGSKNHNNKTYNKYVRPLGGDQTYFSGEDIYFIRDESGAGTPYMTADFQGKNTELQKSQYFFKLNEFLEQLSKECYSGYSNFYLALSGVFYFATLKMYNCNCWFKEQFSLNYFINFLRDKFSIFLCVEDNTISFKYLSFTSKLLDIDNYKGRNWFENNAPVFNEVAKVYTFQSNSEMLDFKEQKVSFYGYNPQQDSVSEGIVTDCEITEKTEDQIILIDTDVVNHNQIYGQFQYNDPVNGTEAIFRSVDGRFIQWDYNNLEESTYIRFGLKSNLIYMTGSTIQISYGVLLYEGSVRVKIGNYDVIHSSSTTVNVYTTTSASVERLYLYVGGAAPSNVRGFLYNIEVRVITLTPKKTQGVLSGASKLNGKLANANTIKNYKPQMSYSKGYFENFGTIDCNVKYSKEINFPIRLDEEIFDLDFDKYMALNSEKWIIFERKRQVLTNQNGEAIISKSDHIKCKSNEIY